MDDKRSLVQALQRDVASYIHELEQRVTQLENTAERSIKAPVGSARGNLDNFRNQLVEVKEICDYWESGQMEKEIDDIENHINNFMTTELPKAIDPLQSQLANWKSLFNRQMSSVGRTYTKLNEQLNLDIKALDDAAREYRSCRKELNDTVRAIDVFKSNVEEYRTNTLNIIENQEKELDLSLSNALQQLNIDLMCVKASTSSTLAQSLANCDSSTFSDIFSTLQGEVNAQCKHMENSIRDVYNLLDKCNQQWVIDLENINSEMKMEIDSMRRNVGSEYSLRRKLEEVQSKCASVEAMLS